MSRRALERRVTKRKRLEMSDAGEFSLRII